ncbi:DUF1365 domain-containing protein [Glycocaulis sp.]|uniref:DUF1365 domain-containing protein n=1 Tax=Glycocaulis sp. TaxID=1969725 RepID=UPI003D236B8D
MMTPPARLFLGHTVHERTQPFVHRFRYAIAMMMLDLDQLEAAGRLSRLFSVERFNLFSFRQRDHGPRDGSSLKEWALARLAAAGVDTAVSRVRLLCSPRVLGYVFNPISLYLADDADGNTLAVIYQVHNTFGDAHAYVAPLAGSVPEKHSAQKRFHVSPFFPVSGRYDFTLRDGDDQLSLVIHKVEDAGKDFLATMQLEARSVSSGSLLKLFATQPFSTLKTISAIHWEAVRLFLRGARYHRRPEPPADDTIIERSDASNEIV